MFLGFLVTGILSEPLERSSLDVLYGYVSGMPKPVQVTSTNGGKTWKFTNQSSYSPRIFEPSTARGRTIMEYQYYNDDGLLVGGYRVWQADESGWHQIRHPYSDKTGKDHQLPDYLHPGAPGTLLY